MPESNRDGPMRRLSTTLTITYKFFGIFLFFAAPLSAPFQEAIRSQGMAPLIIAVLVFGLLAAGLLTLSDLWASEDFLIVRRLFLKHRVPYRLLRGVYAIQGSRMPCPGLVVVTFDETATCGKWALVLLRPRFGFGGVHPEIKFLRSKVAPKGAGQ